MIRLTLPAALLLLSFGLTGLGCQNTPDGPPAADESAAPTAEQAPPHIVFVTGDEEYRSEE